MTTVVLDVNLSLDGFAAGAGSTPGQPLGKEGERLRAWTALPDADRAPRPAHTAGALIAGRRTYDTSLPEWGAHGPHPPTPVFVITHAPPDQPPAHSLYTFITDGIQAALDQARHAAGPRDVRIMGGPALAQQFLAAGLVDEIVVHLVPVLLGQGTRMFTNLGTQPIELAIVDTIHTSAATHIHYRVTST